MSDFAHNIRFYKEALLTLQARNPILMRKRLLKPHSRNICGDYN